MAILTFGLAYGAYLLLCAQVVLQWRDRAPAWLPGLIAAAASAHVVLVWHLFHGWSLEQAWTKSPAAFVIFHAALLLIVAAPWQRAGRSTVCLWLAWPIVTVGALGAVLRRESVAAYFWPMVIAVGVTALAAAWERLAAGDNQPSD